MTPITTKVYPVAYVDPRHLAGADYNPRTIKDAELQQLAHNIAQFGFLDAVSACKEDNELLGGHQRVKATLMLLDGSYVPMMDGKPIEFEPPTAIPVIYIEGLTQGQRRIVNLSLNRIGGDWDQSKLVDVIQDLHKRVMSEIDGEMNAMEAEMRAIHELSVTGFDDFEISNFLDRHEELNDGVGPRSTSGTPKLTLEFSTKELRDQLKAYVAEGSDGSCPSGDSLVKRLEKRKGKK